MDTFKFQIFCSVKEVKSLWYYLYNFKKVKNTHEGVIFLVKLQAEAGIWNQENNSLELWGCKRTSAEPLRL